MLTLDAYLEAPCRRCSIPYWKFRQITVPDTMSIVHDEDLHPDQFTGRRDAPYFRLLHPLDDIPEASLPEIQLRTATTADIPAIAAIINASYTDLSVTEEQVRGFTTVPVYRPELWVMAVHTPTGQAVGCGIAEFDRESGEGSLEWVQVLPHWRRQGVGRLVVTGLLRRMKGLARFATVSGKCRGMDSPELLYRSCGFAGNDVWHILTK